MESAPSIRFRFEPAAGEPGLVSIVVPLFDGFPLVLETIASLRAQTWPRWEAHLVDDGSRAPQEALVRAAVDDPRLRFSRQPNAGPGVARLRGLTEARGEFWKLVDQDDLLDPDLLARQVATLRARPEVDLTYSDVELFEDGPGGRRTVPRRPFFRTPPEGDVLGPLAVHNFLSNEAVLGRRRALDGLALEDLPGNRTTNDWHLWLQLALAGRRFCRSADGLARKRVHAANTSHDWERAVDGRRRVLAWVADAVEARPARLSPRDRALAELEWAKDAALLGRRAEAAGALARALRRDATLLARRPARALLTGLLCVPALRPLLLELRARRDPYLSALRR